MSYHGPLQKCYFIPRGVGGGYFLKIKYHTEECNCVDRCPRTQICPNLMTCTCYDYTFNRRICSHIRCIYRRAPPSEFALISQQRELNHLSISSLVEMLSGDENDSFGYSNYFYADDYFQLNLRERERLLYWKGFEHMLKRHELGKSFQEDQIRQIDNTSWKVYHMTSMERTFLQNESHNVVNFISEKCEFNCSAFKNCKVCASCEHMYSCNCTDYKSGFFCQHCHAVVIMRYGREQIPYNLRNESRYYRDNDRRFYFLSIQTRSRHNKAIYLKVKKEEIDKYRVISLIDHFIVQKINEPCVCNELMSCPVCKICRHTFVCKCRDFESGFLCSHVHAVVFDSLGIDQIAHISVDNASVCSFDTSLCDQLEITSISSRPQILNISSSSDEEEIPRRAISRSEKEKSGDTIPSLEAKSKTPEKAKSKDSSSDPTTASSDRKFEAAKSKSKASDSTTRSPARKLEKRKMKEVSISDSTPGSSAIKLEKPKSEVSTSDSTPGLSTRKFAKPKLKVSASDATPGSPITKLEKPKSEVSTSDSTPGSPARKLEKPKLKVSASDAIPGSSAGKLEKPKSEVSTSDSTTGSPARKLEKSKLKVSASDATPGSPARKLAKPKSEVSTSDSIPGSSVRKLAKPKLKVGAPDATSGSPVRKLEKPKSEVSISDSTPGSSARKVKKPKSEVSISDFTPGSSARKVEKLKSEVGASDSTPGSSAIKVEKLKSEVSASDSTPGSSARKVEKPKSEVGASDSTPGSSARKVEKPKSEVSASDFTPGSSARKVEKPKSEVSASDSTPGSSARKVEKPKSEVSASDSTPGSSARKVEKPKSEVSASDFTPGSSARKVEKPKSEVSASDSTPGSSARKVEKPKSEVGTSNSTPGSSTRKLEKSKSLDSTPSSTSASSYRKLEKVKSLDSTSDSISESSSKELEKSQSEDNTSDSASCSSGKQLEKSQSEDSTSETTGGTSDSTSGSSGSTHTVISAESYRISETNPSDNTQNNNSMKNLEQPMEQTSQGENITPKSESCVSETEAPSLFSLVQKTDSQATLSENTMDDEVSAIIPECFSSNLDSNIEPRRARLASPEIWSDDEDEIEEQLARTKISDDFSHKKDEDRKD